MLDIFWLILIIFITLIGIYFSFKINFKNYNIRKLFTKINKESLFLALGTKMGVGTIIGITMSIYIGGSGSLFWVYIFTLLTSSIIYIESFLGSKYKQKINDSYLGGVYYYTKFGLNNNYLALIVLVLFVSTYSFFFLMIQTNTITNILNINKFIIFFILALLLTFLVTHNFDEIRKVINKTVPLMCMFFIVISLYVLFKNVYILPSIISQIFKSAFNRKSFLIGLIIGIKRSIFLNELLIGTSSMSSSINNENEETTANTLILGSYFIVFIISTLMAFIILIYLNNNTLIFNSYIELLTNAFTYHFGNLGLFFLALLVILLALSTIISGIYIGLSNISYLTTNKKIINAFKILMITFILSGIFLTTTRIWKLIDFMMFLLIITNSFAIIKLRNKI